MATPHDHNHHHHHHQDEEDFTESNRAHWNKFAATYYSAEPWMKELVNKVTAFVHSNINWIGVDFVHPSTTFEAKTEEKEERQKTVRVLDYACGPGTMTHAFGSRATEYVGIDLSENMVQAYNTRFGQDQQSESTDEVLNAHAVVGNLLTPQEPSQDLSGPEYHDFDLVVVGLGYHHFSDVELATRRLVERLRPGGVFLILDFVTHAAEVDADPNTPVGSARHTVAHHGFSEARLEQVFEGAGLSDFGLVQMGDEVHIRGGKVKREPLMARGRKGV